MEVEVKSLSHPSGYDLSRNDAVGKTHEGEGGCVLARDERGREAE